MVFIPRPLPGRGIAGRTAGTAGRTRYPVPEWRGPMQIDKDSFYRHRITPWYDSPCVCWTLVGFSFLVMIFSLTGVAASLGDAAFRDFLWLPLSLAGLSFFLMVSAVLRITSRHRTG
jgi:hypothetical protein